jgi:hypothetical protein
MSLDNIPSKLEKKEEFKVVDQLYTNQAGDFWYIDSVTHAVVILDEKAEIERERQHFVPDSMPQGNQPKFPRVFSHEEIPDDVEKFLENHKTENKENRSNTAVDQTPSPTSTPDAAHDTPPATPVEDPVDAGGTADTTPLPDTTVAQEEPETPPAQEEPEPLDPSGFKLVTGMRQNADKTVTPTGKDYWKHSSTKNKKYSAEEVRINNEKWEEKNGAETNAESTPPNREDKRPADTAEAPKKRKKGGGIGANLETETENASKPWDSIDESRYTNLNVKPLHEVLKDTVQAQLFGEVLIRILPDAAQREELLLHGKRDGMLTAEQRKIIDFALKELARGIKKSNEAIAKIKSSDVALMAKRDETFAQMVTIYGLERMTEALKKEMPHLAMRNPGKVDKLLEAYERLGDGRDTKRYEWWQKDAKKLAADTGIKEEDIDKMFKLNTSKEREETKKRLEEKFYREFREKNKTSLLRFISRADVRAMNQARDKAEDIMKRAIDIDNKTRDMRALNPEFSWKQPWKIIDGTLKPSSRVMGKPVRGARDSLNDMASIMAEVASDENFDKRVVKESFGEENVKDERESGPQTAQNAKEAQANVEAKTQEWFDRDKAVHAAGKGKAWKDLTPAERSEFRNNWEPTEMQQATNIKHQGIWSQIFRSLVKALFSKKREHLKID